ncbi:hypothetical protein [Amycolatopsis thermoflava]|uniref:hypothetical protein n=1 Tax=Amycolatopsis thermoflava TaxID=84480 RepID=UPI0038036BAF
MFTLIMTSLGLLLTLAGTILALDAFVDQFREHDKGPLIPAWARFRSWLRGSAPATGQLQAVGVAASFEAAGRISVRGPDVREDASVEEKLKLMLRRIETIESEAMQDREYVERRVEELKDVVSRARSDVDRRFNELDASLKAKVKSLAVGTVRQQILGLCMVGAGSLVAAVPTISQAIAAL